MLYRLDDDELLERHPFEETPLDAGSVSNRSSRLRCDAVVDGGGFDIYVAAGTHDVTGSCDVTELFGGFLTAEAAIEALVVDR